MKLKVRDKILITVVAVFLLSTALNTFVVSHVFRKEYSAALQSKMDVIANTLRSQIEKLLGLGIAVENIEGFEAQCRESLRKHKDVAYVMVTRKNGEVLFHNDPTRHGTMINDPEILKALKNDWQTACLSKIAGRTYYNTVMPVRDGSDGPTSAVIVGFPTTLIDNKIQELLHYSFTVALASLSLAIFLLLTILSISVTKPLSSLVATIRQIRDSADLDKRVTVKSTDEIGELAVSFNQMVEDLNKTTVSRDFLMKEVAERKRAEEALRESKQRLNIVLNSILTGVVIVDAETHEIVDSNPLAAELIGLPKEEIIGKVCNKFICPAEVGKCPISNLGQTVDQSERVLIRGDGKEISILKTVTPAFWQGRSYFVESFIDITERKKAEQRQAQLLEQLEKINKELNDFAYVISHDLKAPLRGIKTLTEWITTDYADKLDENGKEQMNLLERRVDRMHNLIDGVLQYSRVGRVKEDMVQINLNELIPEAIDSLAPPENISITIETELPTIKCERTRIMQVFQNLLSNAVKYMDKPQGQIKVGCIEENGFWKFYVADNGPGIEEKYFEKIFQMFQTLAPRDGSESTGIGLTLVKKIIEMYKGSVWVESEVGNSSTFFFTLPKQKKGVKNAKLQANIVS
jgi:two-component system sensor kinase FixL